MLKQVYVGDLLEKWTILFRHSSDSCALASEVWIEGIQSII